jgi:hypothetical protein
LGQVEEVEMRVEGVVKKVREGENEDVLQNITR